MTKNRMLLVGIVLLVVAIVLFGGLIDWHALVPSRRTFRVLLLLALFGSILYASVTKKSIGLS